MAEIKLTKNELRGQARRLTQLQKYLPTLQLKKAMLQSQVYEARLEIAELEETFNRKRLLASQAGGLLSERIGFDLRDAAHPKRIIKRIENIAGVDIPLYEGIEFTPFDYSLFSTPPWVDAAIEQMRDLVEARAKVLVAEEKKKALEKELREVTLRVNLFEKNLIPKTKGNIKKIKVFLGDQELAAVSQAKVAKTKIEERKKERRKRREL